MERNAGLFKFVSFGYAGTVEAELRRMKGLSRHVLIVEDYYAIREALKASLELNGYSVSLAQDGLEALALLENLTPSIVLLNLNLPRMDGYTLLETLEKQRPDLSLPIIVISGDPQAATRLAQKSYKLVPFHSLLTIIQETLHVDKGVSNPS